jgi:hypothetical protein
LKRIEQWAFLDCFSLRSISIPPSVKSLPRGCFDRCPVKSLRIVKLELLGLAKRGSHGLDNPGESGLRHQ